MSVATVYQETKVQSSATVRIIDYVCNRDVMYWKYEALLWLLDREDYCKSMARIQLKRDDLTREQQVTAWRNWRNKATIYAADADEIGTLSGVEFKAWLDKWVVENVESVVA